MQVFLTRRTLSRMRVPCWAGLSALVMLASCMVDATAAAEPAGRWTLLVENAGIASIHTAVTHYDTVILLDQTNIGASKINFTNEYCRVNPDLNDDCSAHSVMLDPSISNNNNNRSFDVRPLTVVTDTWCSSGQFVANGSMVQTGGENEGWTKIRRLDPCTAYESCDWVELDSQSEQLADGRWYSTNQLLPDGRQIVVGGRNVYTYEFVPKKNNAENAIALSFLQDVQDNNLYPFVHLLPNKNLFIFANRDSILLDYESNVVRKRYPRIPNEPRNYPSAGSSVMLPLEHADDFTVAEVLVCGGAQDGASLQSDGWSLPASDNCGRIVATAEDAEWIMETMPVRRTMGDMVILPTGDVLIVNGARNGCQGWGKASRPALHPVQYATRNATSRFRTFAASSIPRMYHSTANLLSDGRILIAGSNTHQYYTFTGQFPTELRVEAFHPPYLDSVYDSVRPWIHRLSTTTITYGSTFLVVFRAYRLEGEFEMNLVSSPFSTHSFSQGQRMARLATTTPRQTPRGAYAALATAPRSATVAPPSWYMLFAVQAGVPGKAVWVRVSSEVTSY